MDQGSKVGKHSSRIPRLDWLCLSKGQSEFYNCHRDVISRRSFHVCDRIGSSVEPCGSHSVCPCEQTSCVGLRFECAARPRGPDHPCFPAGILRWTGWCSHHPAGSLDVQLPAGPVLNSTQPCAKLHFHPPSSHDSKRRGFGARKVRWDTSLFPKCISLRFKNGGFTLGVLLHNFSKEFAMNHPPPDSVSRPLWLKSCKRWKGIGGDDVRLVTTNSQSLLANGDDSCKNKNAVVQKGRGRTLAGQGHSSVSRVPTHGLHSVQRAVVSISFRLNAYVNTAEIFANTWRILHGGAKIIFEWWKRLTNERSEWVKYRFHNEKIKFISSSRRVLFFWSDGQQSLDISNHKKAGNDVTVVLTMWKICQILFRIYPGCISQ